jgi:excisionase family DNA binding protein
MEAPPKGKEMPMTSQVHVVLTTTEAAAYLSVKPTTLEQWRWNGRGPRFAKIGRTVRYRQVDLDDFITNRLFSSTTEAQAQ